MEIEENVSSTPPPPSPHKTTTVLRLPDRGDWATHVGNYQGNWSPYIPCNLILRYTAPGELVLDRGVNPRMPGHTCLRPPEARLGMMGSGARLVECRLLGWRGINPDAVMVVRNWLDFSYAPADYMAPEIRTDVGDAHSLSKEVARKMRNKQIISNTKPLLIQK